MRIASWNMGCGPRTRYRRTHSDAWRYLLDELRPDVAFVQEALLDHVVDPALGELFWSTDRTAESGSAIFVRTGTRAEALSVRVPASYVAAVAINEGDTDRVFASIHVGPGDYQRNRRVLADALVQFVKDRRFVIGGDFNTARHWDSVYGGRQHTDYFDHLKAQGFHDCHWSQHRREVQTFWGHQTKEAYQCDHFFIDAESTAKQVDCHVIDNISVRTLSDHAPLQFTLATDASIW